MAMYQFFAGSKKSQVLFLLTNEGLTMQVNHLNEEYVFKWLDGMLTGRYSSDWGVEKSTDLFAFYHSDSKVTVDGNTIEFITVPKHKETGKTIAQVKAINRFTVMENTASIVQETFFEVDGVLYDCSYIIGKTQIDIDSFYQFQKITYKS